MGILDSPISVPMRAALNGKVNKGELLVNVKDYGAKGDGVTDDTDAFAQAQLDAEKKIKVPAGTYIINTVSLTKSLEFIGEAGTVLKRKGGVNTSTTGHWNPGAAMFELDSPGLRVMFSDFTYDGNNANQTSTEPIGYFLKTYPTATITSSPTTVVINRGNFINGTSGYLLLRGDDVQKRYETFAYLHDCTFSDTVPGKGKGDPSTPSALGYSPTYVLTMDYVRLRTTNFRAEFNSATPTGVYAPCAINGTYYGSTYANSGEAALFMHGTTYLKNMGRSIKSYDDANWNTNNAIGAIDMYGNPDTVFVENVVAVNSQFVTIRSKGSIKNYTVLNASLTNCQRGLQVSASSTGPCEAVVRVGHVAAIGGGMPLVEMVGTSTTDRLRHVSVGSVHLLGPFNNVEGLAVQGAVHARNITRMSLGDTTIVNAVLIGATFVDVQDVAIRGLKIDGTSNAGVGLYVSGGDNITVEQVNINNTAASGINFINNPKKIVLRDGRITNATDYGVFSNTSTSELLVQCIEVDTVGGLSRAFYAGGGNVAFENNKSNATTNLLVASGTRKRERNNSWNAAQAPGTAAPTVGTYSVGDIIWNSAPAASGTMGWVCVTAGTPGTWKTFGSISA
ncbi:right-handed parallel beta-helix repeat-containing protein [Paenarthrobacter ureafaciens]|uniref:right-handed parallel beta-helix repeat-containing protein n=1 Tax=Paenarthrobacter ureafaciens TaxID=37931 RepID=UPI0034641806